MSAPEGHSTSTSAYRDRPGATFRMVARLFKLAISTIIVISIVPFISGDVKVDLPESSSFNWSYQNWQFVFAAPVKICNGGFYDISDISVNYHIENSTGYKITEAKIEWGAIPARSEVTKILVFSIDCEGLIAESDWMLSHPDSLHIGIEINANYIMRLISFSLEAQIAFPWDNMMFSLMG